MEFFVEAESPAGEPQGQQQQQQQADQQQPKPASVRFSPEQQARIDQIIKQAMGRAGSEARAEAEKLRLELAALKTAAPKSDDNGGALELAAQLHEAKAERDKLAAERTEAVVRAQLLTVAGVFIDPELGADILQRHTKLIDGKLQVVDAAGNPRMNASYEPMSLSELAAETAAARPYLVRSTLRGGSGSVERTSFEPDLKLEKFFGKTSDSKAANQLSLRDPKRYRALREQAKAKGLI